ncbi:hypothetical protein JW906_08135 [bacterium]|nr:hypothetical protein [bacterium]
MRRFSRHERGTLLVVGAVALFSMFGFASIAIDVGCIVTAKNQLQIAVDASALSGASGLIVDQDEAVSRAVATARRNTCIEKAVFVDPGHVEFPAADRIRVRANRSVPLFLAKLFGVQTAQISATAVAEIGTLVGTQGMRPWSVPDMHWMHGTAVVLKAGDKGAPGTNPSFYYPICFPPVNRGDPITGASIYEYHIVNGTDCTVSIGDEILVEPGNMVGPTRQGVDALIAMDPQAAWDGTRVTGSLYPDMTSPRIIKIPLYDPDLAPESGRNTIIVTGLASFFVTGMQGNNVIGIFLKKVTTGRFGYGNSLLKGVRLVS